MTDLETMPLIKNKFIENFSKPWVSYFFIKASTKRKRIAIRVSKKHGQKTINTKQQDKQQQLQQKTKMGNNGQEQDQKQH